MGCRRNQRHPISGDKTSFFGRFSGYPLVRNFVFRKEKNSLTVDFVFYVTGEYPVPISWTDINGKKEFSGKRVLIESSIPDSDTGPADIIPPLTFSGPYLGNLFTFFILVVLLLVFGIYIYRIYTRKSSPIDAIIQSEPMPEKMEVYEIRLNELLKQSPVPARDFARLLSGYIREKSASLSGKKLPLLPRRNSFVFCTISFHSKSKNFSFGGRI
ncbi:hypothetical protein LEP1GSC137_0289 [Leptospira borgpetersenii str. Noumea 25]|nr:hypothetical protein LEP1GSC137_0289 [Leptospira borgpetersenii str. Noumea 25]